MCVRTMSPPLLEKQPQNSNDYHRKANTEDKLDYSEKNKVKVTTTKTYKT